MEATDTPAADLVAGDKINLLGEVLTIAATDRFTGTVACVELTFTDGTISTLPAIYNCFKV